MRISSNRTEAVNKPHQRRKTWNHSKSTQNMKMSSCRTAISVNENVCKISRRKTTASIFHDDKENASTTTFCTSEEAFSKNSTATPHDVLHQCVKILDEKNFQVCLFIHLFFRILLVNF